MPKVTSPLYTERLPAFITDVLNFTSDGNVRQERHITPAPTPGVAESRLLVKAIDPALEKIHAGLRDQLLTLFPSPGNWAGQIVSRTIGSRRSNWAADAAAYAALPLHMRADWNLAADFADLKQVAIQDTEGATHSQSAAAALFHVATGVYRSGVNDQPAQPAADNANAWASFLLGADVVYPDDVMTLDGETMALGEDYLTF